MPLVSATDVPLQPWPTGRTSPQAPDAYERIQTSPSMFGSIQAEALEKAGAQGEKLATEVAKIGAYQQHYLNLAEKDKLAVELGDAQHRRVYGDPTAGLDANGQPLVPGFANRYGSDAISYIQSGAPRKDFQSDIDRIAATASNPMVRQAFLREANAKRVAFDDALARHFNSQLNTHNDNIQKAKTAQADRDASYAWNDDNALIDSMNKGREAVVAALGNETNPDIVNAQIAASDAARVGMAIDAALANNNPQRAKELLDRYSAGPNPTFSGKLAEHYYSRIQPKLDEQAAGRANAAVGQGARAAAAAYAEDSRIIGEIDKAVKAATDASRDKDPTVLADITSQVRTKLGASALEAAIAQGNLGRAQRLLQTFSDTMTGEQLQRYHAQIKPLLDKEIAERSTPGRVPGGQPLVPHDPAPDTLGAIGFTPTQYQVFRNHVAERESGSYAQPPNAGGYMGRFQMGRQEIRETAARLGVPEPTQQQFLGDPQLQERFFENYTLDHHLSLMEQSATYRNASPAERAGILMGAHLGGVQGVLRYLNSGGRDDPADSNGTRVSSYVTSMRQRFAVGGSMPPTPPSSFSPYVPGTTTPPPAAPDTPAPAAPAPAPAPPAPRAAGTGPIEVWGDSLGVGLKGALKSEGITVGGAPPSAILANIRSKPDDYWNGKLIALASGSNRSEMDVVEKTVEYLRDPKRGADVVLIGYGPVFPEKNAKLREIAQRLNVPVIDAEGFGPRDGVHPGPQGYLSMAGRIRALRSPPIVVPRPDPNARPPAGMVAPGNMTPPNFAPTP